MRSLLRSPGFTILAVGTLALGIGACTAIFSVVHAVLLRPLPYPEPARLVGLWSKNLRSGNINPLSAPDYLDLQARTDLFEATTAFSHWPAALSAGEQAARAPVAHVTDGFFRVLQVQPARGRLFEASEWQAGNAAVISERLARRFFGDPAKALEATLRIDGAARTIVGVMPSAFHYPGGDTDVWSPLPGLDPTASRSAHNWRAAARLRAGISSETANAAVDAMGTRFAQLYPESNAKKTFGTLPLSEHQVRRHRATIWTLLGAVVLVLLIACANVANLLLARGVARQRELAVRAALGASPRQLLLLQFRESAVLAALAAVVGTLIGVWCLAALVALAPPGVPRLEEVGLDLPTLLGTAGLALLASVLTGCLPALRAARTDVVTSLKSGGAAVAGGRSSTRAALVVGQLALSLGLLTVAGLLLKSFWKLTQVDPGFRPEQVLVMEVTYPASTEEDGVRAFTFFDALKLRAQELPGVQAVSHGSELPLGRLGANGRYQVDGRPDPAPGSTAQQAVWRFVGEGYFSTLGIPLLRGRDFAPSQRTRSGAMEVIINETMARASWPGQDPLGQRIRIGVEKDPPWMTVVGVVRDVRQGQLDQAIDEELYVAAAQYPARNAQQSFVIRAQGAVESLIEPLRKAAATLDAGVPVQFRTAEMVLGETLATPRFRAQLIGLFAGLALVIALVGVGGVMAVIVAGRKTEVGIRLALGATPRDVVLLMLREGLRFVALGLAGGAVLALLGGRALQAQLFEVGSFDPGVFLGVAALFAMVAAGACLVPSLRAAWVTPTAALRSE